MSNFLPEATDFADIPKMAPAHGRTIECPLCHGHGKWNLTLNAYPGHSVSPHFQQSCRQCWGWGYVESADATCLHDFVEVAPDQPFRCWHTIQCKTCGQKRSYSSDD